MEILTNARKNYLKKLLSVLLSSNSSWNSHPKMAAALPKRHLVAVKQMHQSFPSCSSMQITVSFLVPNKYSCSLLNACCAKNIILLLMEGIQLQIELSSEK